LLAPSDGDGASLEPGEDLASRDKAGDSAPPGLEQSAVGVVSDICTDAFLLR
jgi:hypothetical protein